MAIRIPPSRFVPPRQTPPTKTPPAQNNPRITDFFSWWEKPKQNPLENVDNQNLPPAQITMPHNRPAGSANADDVALVNAELAKIPEQYRQQLVQGNAQIITVRNSVTEYYTQLKGVQPRGWPPGSTWDSVAGAASGKEAVIATVGHANGSPRLNNLGSYNVVLHETGHVLHHISGFEQKGFPSAFIQARNADYNSLSDYEKQPGSAGLQETFAESFANAFTNPAYKNTHPNLYAYWQSLPTLK